jgi:hypothetical protein
MICGVVLLLLCAAVGKADPLSLQITSWDLTWNANLQTTKFNVSGVDSANRAFSLSLGNAILNFTRGTLTADTVFNFTGDGGSYQSGGAAVYALIGGMNVSGLPHVTGVTPPGPLPVNLSLDGNFTLALFSSSTLHTLYTITLTGLTGAGVYNVGTSADLDVMRVSGNGGAGALIPVATPEPATLILLGSGLVALGMKGRRRKHGD